jgi:hypothetical protein
MYQGPTFATFAGLLILVSLPNLPNMRINLPTYQLCNLARAAYRLTIQLTVSWKFREEFGSLEMASCNYRITIEITISSPSFATFANQELTFATFAGLLIVVNLPNLSTLQPDQSGLQAYNSAYSLQEIPGITWKSGKVLQHPCNVATALPLPSGAQRYGLRGQKHIYKNIGEQESALKRLRRLYTLLYTTFAMSAYNSY